MFSLLRRFAKPVLVLCSLMPLPAQSRGAAPSQPKWTTVPFVGCKSDGQTGPVEAPGGTDKKLAIPAASASRLAYYEAKFGSGVLAPRGWHCFCTYGSNGSSLFVSPRSIGSAEFFSAQWKGFDGPAIQISIMLGDTSGRFSVARDIARVFPAHSLFVGDVIAEGIEPASEFVFGPYPDDTLNYLTREMVEFRTPANTDGMGTVSWLRKNSDPISGVLIVSLEEPDLLHLSVRLPLKMAELIPLIVQHAEPDETLH